MPPPPLRDVTPGKLQGGAHAALCVQRNCAAERFQTQKRLRHIPVANHFFAQIKIFISTCKVQCRILVLEQYGPAGAGGGARS